MKAIVIRPDMHLSMSVEELWAYRELFYILAWRDIKVRYKQTAIGILWAILQPLVTMIIFSLFFGKSFNNSIGLIPYAVFSYSGLLFWNYFSSSLNAVSMSFFTNKTIVTKVFFPRIIIPISAAITPGVDFLFAFILFIPLLLYFHIVPPILSILVILFCLILSFIVTIAIGLSLAIVNVKYRDVQYAVPFFIQLLLFVTPVIYPVKTLPQNYQLLLYLNPMTSIVEFGRSSIFHTAINWTGVLVSLGVTVLLFMFSVYVFKRYEAYIADVV